MLKSRYVWMSVFYNLIKYRNKIETASDTETMEILDKVINTLKKKAKVDIQVLGKENLPDDTGYLYVCNHQSRADVIFVFEAVKRKIAFIAKQELEGWFYIGRYIRRLGGELIDRDDIRSQLSSIQNMINKLKNKDDVFIFPEGTCSQSHEMLDFKPGTFKIAIKAKAPIVPLALHNSIDILEGDKKINKGTAYVSVLPPIPYEDYQSMKPKEVAAYVQAKINEELQKNKHLI